MVMHIAIEFTNTHIILEFNPQSYSNLQRHYDGTLVRWAKSILFGKIV